MCKLVLLGSRNKSSRNSEIESISFIKYQLKKVMARERRRK